MVHAKSTVAQYRMLIGGTAGRRRAQLSMNLQVLSILQNALARVQPCSCSTNADEHLGFLPLWYHSGFADSLLPLLRKFQQTCYVLGAVSSPFCRHSSTRSMKVVLPWSHVLMLLEHFDQSFLLLKYFVLTKPHTKPLSTNLEHQRCLVDIRQASPSMARWACDSTRDHSIKLPSAYTALFVSNLRQSR